MIRGHYFCIQLRHRCAMCGGGGFPGRHPRSKSAGMKVLALATT